MNRSFLVSTGGNIAKLALACAMTPAFAQAARGGRTQAGHAPAAEDTEPKQALVNALEAACRENGEEFAGYLLANSARSFDGLPPEQRKNLLKRFSLTTLAGRPRALLDAQGQTVVRCDTPAETVTYRLSPPQIDANVAFVTVWVEGGEKVDFGLVRQPGGWRLFSLGLLVINVPALVQQWQQAELKANEQAVATDLVSLARAIDTYRQAFGDFPDKIAQLGPAPPGQVSPDHAQLVPEALAAGDTDGYRFRYRIVLGQHAAPGGFELGAVPDRYGKTGRKSFFLDQNGKLHAADKQGAPATVEDPEVTPPRRQDGESEPRGTRFRDDLEQDSGMKATTGSAMEPNRFRPIPERCPPSPE